MDSGYSALLGVYQEDGDAIGGLNGQQKARAIGDGGVPSARVGWSDAGVLVEKVNNIGMDLLQRNELKVVGAERGLEAAAIFEYLFFRVPVNETKVQYLFAI